MNTAVVEIEAVDLSDLDLLDDESAHARCTYCYPGDVTLKPIRALCGATAIQQHGPTGTKPPNACEACEAAWDRPCGVCGR